MVAFIAWIAFILLEQETNVNLMKNYVKIKIFCGIAILLEKNNILEYNQ